MTPEAFVTKHWSLVGDVLGVLVTGSVTLFLDGLNEMGITGVDKVGLLRKWILGVHGP